MLNSGAKGTGGIGKEKWVFIWVKRGLCLDTFRRGGLW